MTQEVAQRAVELPWHHRDPADRILIATAMELDLLLLTPDPLIRAYQGVRIAWVTWKKRPIKSSRGADGDLVRFRWAVPVPAHLTAAGGFCRCVRAAG